MNVKTGETIVIPPMKVEENSYISGSPGMQIEGTSLVEESASPLSIIGADNRYEIESPGVYPYSAVVRLALSYASGTGKGTGFFVAPNIIMTAGHCLLDQGAGEVVSIMIQSGGLQSPQILNIEQCYVPQRWSQGFLYNYDYGLIILADDSIGNTVGTLNLSAKTDSQLIDARVGVCGFPAESNGVLYEHINYIRTLGLQNIYYDVDTTAGQSGSPVWLATNRSTVVGIHTRGFSDDADPQRNSGIRITSDIIAAVNSFTSN